MRRSSAVLLCVLGLSAGASAQEQPAAPVPAPAQEPAERGLVAEPTKDLFDLLRQLRDKPEPPPPGPEDYKKWMVAVAPVVTYGPTSGFGLGVAGNMALYRGFPDTTRISFVVPVTLATIEEMRVVPGKPR